MQDKAIESFRDGPVSRAVLRNALPAMAAMLMVLIYNLADTFFIGQTGNAILVAAASLAMPVFMFFSAVGTVFGIGGTSVISRALGEGRPDYAKKVCSFCMWGSVVAGVVLTALFLAFMDPLLRLIGASDDTFGPAKTYLTIVSCSGPFVVVANCYSNVVRAEGQSTRAMLGQLLGNLLNVVLDPIMILAFNWGIAGAAIATVIGNVFSAVFYLLFYLRGKSMLSIHPRDCTVRGGVCTGVLAIGIPAALSTLLMSFSQILVNGMIARCSDLAVAGYGVAMKLVMMTGMVSIGLGAGVQPLLGYCVGAKLWERFRQSLRFSLIFALALNGTLTLLCYLFTNQIAGAFLSDPDAMDYAVRFAKIMMCTGFLFGVLYVLTGALQAMGAAKAALVVNLSRQGIIFLPAVFLLHALGGMMGLVWAQPVSDVISFVLAAALCARTTRRMMARDAAEPQA